MTALKFAFGFALYGLAGAAVGAVASALLFPVFGWLWWPVIAGAAVLVAVVGFYAAMVILGAYIWPE